MIEVRDAAGRVLLSVPAESLPFYAEAARRGGGAARYYGAPVYIPRPRSRQEWRAWAMLRDIMRAEINFHPFFV